MVARMAPLGSTATVACALLALHGVIAWSWLQLCGAIPTRFEAIVCAAPLFVGLALANTSQDDRQQYVARLMAASMMLPILLMMWAGSQDSAPGGVPHAAATRPWIFFVAWCLSMVAIFAASLCWLASTTTRVEPAAHIAPLRTEQLERRIRALAFEGSPFAVSACDELHAWQIDLALDDDARTHRVLLDLDSTAKLVRVRERIGARGARPRDADEASMRSLCDPAFDGTRPDAQIIHARTAQTTMIDPQRLARIDEQRIVRADAEELVTLLCAIVTRCGWTWQPVMFGKAWKAKRPQACGRLR